MPEPPCEDQKPVPSTEYRNYLRTAKLTCALIKQAIQQIEKQSSKWLDLISSLEDESQDEEQRLYDIASRGPKGMILTMNRASQAIVKVFSTQKQRNAVPMESVVEIS
uniref:E2F_CC-MB domain-containing protein n=1 Tax=Syphacia muris TaxID=451379 RepID=A0A0N5AVJ8_9BILA